MDDIARDVNIVAIAELIGDPSRIIMLNALTNQDALPAGELAYRAGISPQTASAHLTKLVEGGLLTLTVHGRHRYYSLAGPEVAHAIESLAVIAPPAKVRSLRESLVAERSRLARTCYDHLAGRLGVALTQALLKTGSLRLEERRYLVTEEGTRFLDSFGIDLAKLRQQRRAFALPCLDWSERRYHLAGALGAAFAGRLFQLAWIERCASDRAVRLTESGQQGLRSTFGDAFEF
jgi:DNA-binding transcriptional ArsR family regulator